MSGRAGLEQVRDVLSEGNKLIDGGTDQEIAQAAYDHQRQQIDNSDGQRARHPPLEQRDPRNERIGAQRRDNKEQHSGDEMADQPEEDQYHHHPDENGDASIARESSGPRSPSHPRYSPAMQDREQFSVVRACKGCAIQHRGVGMPGCKRGLCQPTSNKQTSGAHKYLGLRFSLFRPACAPARSTVLAWHLWNHPGFGNVALRTCCNPSQ